MVHLVEKREMVLEAFLVANQQRVGIEMAKAHIVLTIVEHICLEYSGSILI